MPWKDYALRVNSRPQRNARKGETMWNLLRPPGIRRFVRSQPSCNITALPSFGGLLRPNLS